MAMKHRKLFPTSDTNQTADCIEICDANCPYGCYPDLAFTPPPPPPPQLAPPPATTNHSSYITPYVIVIVTLLGSVFLLLFYYAIMVRYCACFRRRPTQSDGGTEEFLDENHGPMVDHPIWYITTVGLQPSVISSITVVKFKKGDSLIEGTDCSVCLNEFQENETLRLLPKCSHAFHIPCIDTWLRSHTNCPLCRSGIMSNTSSNDENPRDFGSNENTQMENSESGRELHRNQVRESEAFEETAGVVGIEISKRIQRVRRSVSMDLSAGIMKHTETKFSSRIESAGSSINPILDDAEENSRNIRRKVGAGFSISESVDKGPVVMKRSVSSPNTIFPH